MTHPALEISVGSARGARAARAGGADRVEVCTGQELGGLTPSQGLVEAAVQAGLPVHVLVRCRPGDFVYDADEIATMERELRAVLRCGVAGVVLGALDGAGRIDAGAVRRLGAAAREASPSAELTFHRAVDHAADPLRTVAELAALGFDRVLTSGGAARAGDGIGVLERMVSLGGVQVMAGGGVTPGAVPLLRRAGVHAVHLSAKRVVRGPAPAAVPLGLAADDTHLETDPGVVRAARAALDGALPPG